MGYVVFEGRHKGNTGSPSVEPSISFGPDGRITLNKAAMEMLKYTYKVCLLWDADRQRVGVKPANLDDPNGYVVTRPNSYSCGQVQARGFGAFVGLELAGHEFTASIDGDILSVAVGDAEYLGEGK